MLHLIKYSILVKLRNFNMTFWPLVFPLILGTFFFFAFGNLNDADFETVQVALVRETTDNPLFDFYLDQVQKSDSDLISLHEMTEQKALAALKNKEISGIYYAGMTPSLQSTHTESRKAFCSPFWKVITTVCTPYGRF